MSVPRPHFLLFSDAQSRSHDPQSGRGKWRFVLEPVDGQHDMLQAEDIESESSADRLALLAVVRGLEALDQPSRVTLVTNNRYVARGLRFGLPQWRDNQWRWERFGQMAPVRDNDLWRRVDRALQYHRVECRAVGLEWQAEPAFTHQPLPAAPAGNSDRLPTPATGRTFRKRPGRWRRAVRAITERWHQLHATWSSDKQPHSASQVAC